MVDENERVIEKAAVAVNQHVVALEAEVDHVLHLHKDELMLYFQQEIELEAYSIHLLDHFEKLDEDVAAAAVDNAVEESEYNKAKNLIVVVVVNHDLVLLKVTWEELLRYLDCHILHLEVVLEEGQVQLPLILSVVEMHLGKELHAKVVIDVLDLYIQQIRYYAHHDLHNDVHIHPSLHVQVE